MTNTDGSMSAKTSLQNNPFAILGATTRDSRSRLIELADEVALVSNNDEAQSAQSALLNIRTRLAAEMSWLPGVAPKKAATIVNDFATEKMRQSADDLPPLARANVLSSTAQATAGTALPDEVTTLLYRLAIAIEDVSIDTVVRDINEDRSVAGFPQVRDEGIVLEEFETRKAEYRKAINDTLSRLPSRTLVKVMEAVVHRSTKEGSVHAPAFVQEIVAAYEYGLKGFIEAESSNAESLVRRGINAAANGEASVFPVIDEIGKLVGNFNTIVGPVQLIAKTNGIEHAATQRLAVTIRGLAITLHNEHSFVEAPARITSLLNDHFGLLDTLLDQVSQDQEYLKEAVEGKKRSEAERVEFEKEITYSADIGAVFKDRVSISPAGVSWQNNHIALEAVTRFRWGGTRNSVNGIPTGTNYMIFLGDARSSFTINTRKSDIYGNLIDRIWRTIGLRLLLETIGSLKSGKQVRFGTAIVQDDGVILPRHKLFGSREAVTLGWSQVNVWSKDGSFFIGSRTDKNVYSSIPYQSCDNVPVLENLIRAFFKTDKAKVSLMFD